MTDTSTAAPVDVIIEIGADYSNVLTWKDSSGNLINVTGYTAAAVGVRVPGGTPLFSLTQASGITLGGAAGTITLAIPGATTAAYPASIKTVNGDLLATGSWHLVMTSPGGAITKLAAGGIYTSAA